MLLPNLRLLLIKQAECTIHTRKLYMGGVFFCASSLVLASPGLYNKTIIIEREVRNLFNLTNTRPKQSPMDCRRALLIKMERGDDAMKQYLAGKIRNVALAGHSSSGKTTLAEALLYKTGYSDRLGKVADGNTVCDFDPEEIKRKVSVSSTVAPFAWGSTKINLIDTPGLFDFEGGMYEGMIAAESALITVSARDGVEVGTEKAYELADRLGRAKMFFVTQMDMDHADFYKVLEQLKSEFGPSVCPLVVPFMKDGKVDCYINLIDNKAYRYENGVTAEAEMPDTGHRLEGLIAAMSEAIAETDEGLFEKFFSGEQFTRDEILHGIHQGVKSGSIAPVFWRLGCDHGRHRYAAGRYGGPPAVRL